jgi:serine/threonine-protein kinase HipA
VYVYANWQELGEPILMGELYSERLKGKKMFSFEYNKTWVQLGHAQLLDPEFQLYLDVQHQAGDQNNFGLFLDSSPDR